MFDIEYKGGNAIVISTKKVGVAIDPKRSVFGKKDLAIKDGVELATERRFLTGDAAYRVSLEGAGEYEVSDIQIKGVPTYRHLDDPKTATKDSTIYVLTINGIRIAVLGNIVPDLTDEQLEEIGVVDILVVPVGGNGYTLDATAAVSVVKAIDPKIVVPVHYAEPTLSYEVPQDKLDDFINTLKAPVVEEPKLKIKTEQDLPPALEVRKLALAT
ncbi:MAG: MBL fold metallo-hydrolase [Candidatus Nomurabacteria bacterium]|nr:MBL fold metallo-hydrolase [Candidatus Nomurabacteria bacterium]